MNTDPEEIGPEVPEADALDQRISVLPEGTDELTPTNEWPDDAPQPDLIEQRTAAQPGIAGREGIAATEVEAAEADLIDQATGLSTGNEDDYPEAREVGSE